MILFVVCMPHYEYKNITQIQGVMYMKIIAIIEDDQHIGDVLERTLVCEEYGHSTCFLNIRRIWYFWI